MLETIVAFATPLGVAAILAIQIISKLGIWKAKDATIEQKEATIQRKEAEVAEKEATIQRREADLAAKDTTIEQKDATIETLREQLAALERFRAKEFVEDTEGRIRELETLYESAVGIIGRLVHGVKNGKWTGRELAKAKERLEEREKQIEALKVDIDRLTRMKDKPDVQEFTSAAVSAIQSVGTITGHEYLGRSSHVHSVRGEAYCPKCQKEVWTHHGGCAECGGPVQFPPDRDHQHDV